MVAEPKDKNEDDVNELEEESEEDEDTEDRFIDDEDDDDIDLSAEINVEELVAKIDSQNKSELERKKAIKRRLEEIQEQKLAMQDLDSTYNFNLDDDF